MRVLLVNLYPPDTIARYLISSYVLAGYLEKVFKDDASLSVEVLNYGAEDSGAKVCEEIIKRNPDCVGYSSYVWNINKVLEIVGMLKSRARYIHVFGGPEISLDFIRTLPAASGADYYVIGEGEKRFAGLISYLNKKDTCSGTGVPPGVAFRDEKGVRFEDDREEIADLDDIPSIYLNAVLPEGLYAGRQAFLETQRGCGYKCKYCVYHKNLSKISFYSLERVFSELDYLIREKRIYALRIFDALFTSDLERAKSIVKHIGEAKKDASALLSWIYWEFNYRNVDEEFLKLVSSLRLREKISNAADIAPEDRPQLYGEMLKGYVAVNCVGIQSFNREALKAVGRMGVEREEIRDFMVMAQKHNIALKIDLILGLPFETIDTYFEGLDFLIPFLRGTDHILNIHRLQILPGSDLAGMCGKYEVKYSAKAPHIVFSTKHFQEDSLEYASRVTALLFRILNSPLRRYFFNTAARTKKGYSELVKDIYAGMTASGQLTEAQLFGSGNVHDDYWNNEIFREIPSQWLINAMGKCGSCP